MAPLAFVGAAAKRVTQADWPRIVERLGVATVLCAAVCWGCYRGLAWIGLEIIKPLVQEQIDTTHALRTEIPKITEVLKQSEPFQRAVLEDHRRQCMQHDEQIRVLNSLCREVAPPPSPFSSPPSAIASPTPAPKPGG